MNVRRFARFLTIVRTVAVCSVFIVAQTSVAGDATEPPLAERFQTDVQPFVTNHCLDCHGPEEPEGALDLTAFRSVGDVEKHFAVWNVILRRVEDGEMPPPDAGSAPPEEREKFLGWIEQVREDYIEKHVGDPGEVLARRLSAAEYNYTIRDLTGVDMRPASEFPIDPTNEAGFDNSGESLAMTPSLLSKYLDAARTVADHLLFTPDGLDFAPHPVITETDRDKYCVRRIVDFYQRQNTNLADYFFASWELRHQGGMNRLTDVAQQRGLSERYLHTIWQVLHADPSSTGPLAKLRERFHTLPDEREAAREACQHMSEQVQELREKLVFDFPHLRVKGINSGSQTLVLWRNRQQATHRMKLNEKALSEVLPEFCVEAGEASPELVEEFAELCRVFPDAFYVDRRGREYVQRKKRQELNLEKEVRLLSAGFHSMMGYFRDDQPLCELLLTDEQQEELDRLWFELDFIADAPRRQHAGFIWFERAEGRFLVDEEFDDFRSADKHVTSEEMIHRLADAYLAKAQRLDASDVALDAMREHFARINASIRAVEAARDQAGASQIAMLPELAERAYRRPLTPHEREDTLAFYRQLISLDGLSHEDAIRDVLVSVLMSPHFCYRLHPSNSHEPIHPLDDYVLASRLSYFLWSSMPDEELLERARQRTLQDPAVLRAEVRRMLRSPKSRGLAVEFAGNWLGFRHFETHNSVDRQRFPQFDDELRQAMFEEPVQFTLDVLQHDRSVLGFLYADHTFVNHTLAEHYGIADQRSPNENGWTKVEHASRIGRGGILPMAVFLTKNSPGLRTSPVKRGFWVVRQLLGTHIPAPPPNVPELPEDEAELGQRTLRELLAHHRDHPSCASCHEKFDSFGLVFEGYGPIGERRERDLAGNPVQISADFPDGRDRAGIAGLQNYLREARQEEFVDTLCRKLLAYALGRSLILSDEPLVERMRKNLAKEDYSFSSMVYTIVLSPQFLTQRGTEYAMVD